MNVEKAKLLSVKVAADRLTHHGNIEKLLEDAKKIEAYLTGR
jgi:hypothetical protein